MAHKERQQLNIAENEKKEALLQQKQEKKNGYAFYIKKYFNKLSFPTGKDNTKTRHMFSHRKR